MANGKWLMANDVGWSFMNCKIVVKKVVDNVVNLNKICKKILKNDYSNDKINAMQKSKKCKIFFKLKKKTNFLRN